MTNAEQHAKICCELNRTYINKNHDYGNSFSETYHSLGIISSVTRIIDKANRLVSLSTKPNNERKVLDESIKDTLLDMANYCIMTAMELEHDEEDRGN